MAGLEIVVGTYEEFIVCYRAEPLRTDPTKMYLKETFAAHLHTASVRSVASNGKYVATGGADDRICLLDMREGTKVTEFLHHDGTINTLVFSNSGSHLFAGSNDGSMTAVNMSKLSVDKTWKNAHKGGVQSISIHPQGKMALSLGGDMTLKTWDLITGRALFTTALNKNNKYGRVLSDVQWSQDGEYFALIGNRVVDIISIETTRSVRTLEFDTKPTTMCWLSNEEVAVGLESGELVMANIHEEDQLEKLKIYETRLKAIACLGNYIAIASSAGDVSLWHLNDLDFVQICTQQVGCRPICLALMDSGKPLIQEDREDVSGTAQTFEATESEAKEPASSIAMKVTKELAWVSVETEDPVQIAALKRMKNRTTGKQKQKKEKIAPAAGKRIAPKSNGFIEETIDDVFTPSKPDQLDSLKKRKANPGRDSGDNTKKKMKHKN
uniref:Uncharacterized protein n=1 Tax=Anopheles farauti TaxID=69004 RepID=A0A2C9GW69_9DIPT